MNNILFIELLLLCTLGSILLITRNRPRIRKDIMIGSFLYHTLFSIAYYYYSLFYDADSIAYYRKALEHSGTMIDLYGFGTTFVVMITYIFGNVFQLSYFSLFMLFNVFGFFGLLLFYLSVEEQLYIDPNLQTNSGAKPFSSREYLLAFLFIPGLNFWTSAIGKDSIAFLGIGMLMYAISKYKKRFVLLAAALLLILYVRPHIFAIAGGSLAGAFFLRKGLFRFQNILVIIVILGAVYLTQDIILGQIGIANISDIATVSEYVDKRQGFNLGGGSSIDIREYNVLMKVFSYLYRPLFFDARSITMIAASVENLLYIILSVQLMLLPFGQIVRQRNIYILFGIVFFVAMLIVLSLTTANLGIAVRQKNMFVIVILALYCITLSYREQRKVQQ